MGASVADLYSSDPHAHDLFYTLVSNAGGLFGLNSSNEIVLARALDETAAEHAITVKVQDAYGGEFTGNPSPSQSATWSRRILWCAPGRR